MMKLILAIAMVLIATSAFATPFLWVDTEYGDDSNGGWFPNDALKTYAEAIRRGADGDSIGIKIAGPNRVPPTVEESFIFIHKKKDKVHLVTHQRLLQDHGELPTRMVDESADCGLRIIVDYEWEIFVAPNGQPAERLVGITRTVEGM